MVPTEVAKIIALKALPHELETVFFQHGLDYSTRFVYDASLHYMMDYNDWAIRFPNIILTGLAIVCTQSLCIMDVIARLGPNVYKSIKKLIVITNTPYVDVSLSDLDKCDNLQYFRARRCRICDVDALTKCPYIKHVDIASCFRLGLISQQFINKLDFFGFTSDGNAFELTCSDNQLKHLNENYYGRTLTGQFLGLKSLALSDGCDVPLNLVLHESLEFVCLSDFEKIDASWLNWVNLKHIVIINCIEFDASIIDKCSNLITFEVYNCKDILNIEKLIEHPNINLKIICKGINIKSLAHGPNKSFRKYMKLYGEWIDYQRNRHKF